MADSERSIERLVAEATAKTENDGDAAIAIAEQLLRRSRELQTPQERRQQAELDRMIGQPDDKATLVEMTDQAFRTLTPARVADQLTYILDLQGVPRFFSPLERTMLRGFQSFGEYLPGVAVPLVKDKMRRETANVILPAEPEMLTEHLRQRQAEGVRMNVNFLGEALLGEDEARRRLDRYLTALKNPDVECVSVKITTIYSQVSPLAHAHTVRVVADRLELLYRAALRAKFRRPSGEETTKFVYLDMEEYRDLKLTVDAMCNALEREGMESVRAGIALQAYLPDSYGVLEQLKVWARTRVERGGSPLTIRLVKGANMEMERVEASMGGWNPAPYQSKSHTDANYKRMLHALLDPAYSKALRVGVASHNLFDISLAILWASKNKVLPIVQFEMLEGMANHQRRALFEASGTMLLYAPACRREEFLNAIGYLVRRLDENTGRENFLRHSFNLEPLTPVWNELADDFKSSIDQIDDLKEPTRRIQDRNQHSRRPAQAAHWKEYVNEPDTDWSVQRHAHWAESIVATWQEKCDSAAIEVPLVVAAQATTQPRDLRESTDPSRPGVVSCRYREASEDDVDKAIACAENDPKDWRNTEFDYRHQVLRKAAQLMRERRGDLIGSAMADGGKTIIEADAEVSEAIDFAEFYPLTCKAAYENDRLTFAPHGVIAVVSPWNFPLAIPCGGVAAALAAGNTVILKPASDTVLPAYKICECFWDAGVPLETLQLLPCSGSRGGRRLVEDPRITTVILTGGTSTARNMLTARPDLNLIAETGGKNATIVTALSDRDLAIKHVLHSAFSHSGQKCSATSLLLLEGEVYEDAKFQETLADAARSLRVGSVWDLSTKIGPLIRPPRGDLARGMKELEPAESWLVMPDRISNNPQLYRPGIKWNVRPDGFTHRTELFGPVLGVMPYRRLEDAIGIVNATGYGLTSGLESLDEREQEVWQSSIRAGNLYINRPTTGAIVLRQPFGGVGSSAYGPGVKAGGPHYVLPLMMISDREDAVGPPHQSDASAPSCNTDRNLHRLLETVTSADEELSGRINTFAATLRAAVTEEFATSHDTVQVLGQDNLRRYRPVQQMRLRLQAKDTKASIVASIAAAVAVGSQLTVSFDPNDIAAPLHALLEAIADELPGCIELLEQSELQLATAIRTGYVDRLRYLSPTQRSDELASALCEAFVSVNDEPVVFDGYIEALRYLTEQSVSENYHRYGNLGRRPARQSSQ